MIPFVLAIAVSVFGQSLYQDRFLVFTNVFILLALAVAVLRLPDTFRRIAVTLVLIGFVVGSGAFWRELDILNRPGAHAASTFVLEQRQADEPVVVTSPFIYFAVLHYAQEGQDAGVSPRLYSETGELVHYAGGPILMTEDLVGPEIFSQYSGNTMWLVETNGFGGSSLSVPAPWRRTQEYVYDEVFAHQGDVFVHKYER